jgi:hypothetical protein
MKYFFPFLLFIVIQSQAQQKVKIGLVGTGGYTFRATYYGDYAQISIKEGAAYGGMLTFSPNELLEVGFSFLHQDSEADQKNYYPSFGEPSEILNVPIGLNFYEISIIKNFILPATDKVVPYAGIDLGLVDFRKKDGTYNSVQACWGLKAGLKFNLTEAVTFRTQAQLQMPISGIGIGVGVGTGGASVGAYGYSSMIQFSFIGGLGYTFGTK